MKKLSMIFCLAITLILYSCEELSSKFTTVSDIESIKITSDSDEVMVGKSIQLKASVTPKDALYPYYNWSSSNKKIASVDSNGFVNAHKLGSVTISAISLDKSVSGEFKLTIVPYVDISNENVENDENEDDVDDVDESNTLKNVFLALDKLELSVGESYKLHYSTEPYSATYTYSFWTSSNQEILSVDTEGLVKAVSSGTAEVTLTIGNFSDSTTITVIPPIEKVLAPDFSANSGIYYSEVELTLSSGTSGATIYYTTDWSYPDKNSIEYTGPFKISGKKETIKVYAIAYKDGLNKSSITSQMYDFRQKDLEDVKFSPLPGTYSGAQNITLLNSNPSALIYYTLDGSEPTLNSTLYQGEIEVHEKTTIKAFAACDGYNDSSVYTASYSLSSIVVNPVQFSPVGNNYTTDQLVTLSTETDEATIYYTLDGTIPTNDSIMYTGPIPVSGHGSSIGIRAIAFKEGFKTSSITSSKFNVNYPSVEEPKFNNFTRTIYEDFTLAITSETADAEIYYTLDDTLPSKVNGILYSEPISINENGKKYTISAIAYKDEMRPSSYGFIELDLIYPSVLSPDYSLVEEKNFSNINYYGDIDVILSSRTDGADIYYTTDGTDPTTESFLYTEPIPIHGDGTSVTVKSLAVKSGMTDSVISSKTYSIIYLLLQKPRINLDTTYTGPGALVKFVHDTPDVTFHYTINGEVPTVDSPSDISYTTTEDVTLKVIAVKDEFKNSEVVTRSIIIPDLKSSFNTETVNGSGTIVGSSKFNRNGGTQYYTLNVNFSPFIISSIKWFLDGVEITDDNMNDNRINIEMDNVLLTIGQHQLISTFPDKFGYTHTASCVFYVEN